MLNGCRCDCGLPVCSTSNLIIVNLMRIIVIVRVRVRVRVIVIAMIIIVLLRLLLQAILLLLACIRVETLQDSFGHPSAMHWLQRYEVHGPRGLCCRPLWCIQLRTEDL